MKLEIPLFELLELQGGECFTVVELTMETLLQCHLELEKIHPQFGEMFLQAD